LNLLPATQQWLQAADEDGSGELDIDEFCAKLGPHLGVNLKRQQVAQLFMKIDADAGGTVDWCAACARDYAAKQQHRRRLHECSSRSSNSKGSAKLSMEAAAVAQAKQTPMLACWLCGLCFWVYTKQLAASFSWSCSCVSKYN
jgi:hypothetical protein